MKKAIAALLLLPLLSACSNDTQQQEVQQTAWQISEVYVDPDTPAAIPQEVVGAAVMNFGGRSANGFTGCASFNGIVSFTKDGEAASPDDADHLDFSTIEFSPIDEQQCVGKLRYVHDALVHMLIEDTFSVRRAADGSLRVLADTDAIDPQGFRLDPLSAAAGAE